jgi:FtsZ-binding cell division protein ZapB
MNKKDAIATLMLFILFASIVFLSFENQKLKSNVALLLKELNELQENNRNLEKELNELQESYKDLENKTGKVTRKFWSIIAKNITLNPKDTLAVSIYIDSPNGYMGIRRLDRLELTWVGIYSPDLAKGKVKTVAVTQYIGPGLGQAELLIGSKIMAISSKEEPIKFRNPISPNETLVRESINSQTFFFENYNYLGYAMPGTWITVKFFYDGTIKLVISELELYIVGYIEVKANELENFEPAWIGHNVQVEIRPWGGMK